MDAHHILETNYLKTFVKVRPSHALAKEIDDISKNSLAVLIPKATHDRINGRFQRTISATRTQLDHMTYTDWVREAIYDPRSYHDPLTGELILERLDGISDACGEFWTDIVRISIEKLW